MADSLISRPSFNVIIKFRNCHLVERKKDWKKKVNLIEANQWQNAKFHLRQITVWSLPLIRLWIIKDQKGRLFSPMFCSYSFSKRWRQKQRILFSILTKTAGISFFVRLFIILLIMQWFSPWYYLDFITYMFKPMKFSVIIVCNVYCIEQWYTAKCQ